MRTDVFFFFHSSSQLNVKTWRGNVLNMFFQPQLSFTQVENVRNLTSSSYVTGDPTCKKVKRKKQIGNVKEDDEIY